MAQSGSVAAALAVAFAAAPVRAECPLPFTETGVVARAADGGTLVLADGRELLLAGIAPAPGEAPRATLEAFAAGQTITIAPLPEARDRWGRLVAFAATPDGQLSEAMVSRGLAHVATGEGAPCLTPLYSAESKARQARLGLWAEDGYVVSADDGAALTARLGEHVVAEGRLISARTVGERLYLNFARNRREGLSVILDSADWAKIGVPGEAAALAGKRLRVRGTVEWRGGPAILAQPGEPVEFVEVRAGR